MNKELIKSELNNILKELHETVNEIDETYDLSYGSNKLKIDLNKPIKQKQRDERILFGCDKRKNQDIFTLNT